LIASAMDNLWDEQDEFFYDRLRTKDGSSIGAGAFDGGPSSGLRRSAAGRLVMAAIAYVSGTGALVP
jgi:hypothetical protein